MNNGMNTLSVLEFEYQPLTKGKDTGKLVFQEITYTQIQQPQG